MNNVSLIGRLTADPELRHTQSGIATTRFSIAVDRTYVKHNITAWRQTAEFICRYFSKGSRVGITGSIRTGSYTDRDGNKRYSFDVVADNVYFADSKNSSGSSGNYSNNSYSDNNYQQSSYRPSAPQPAATYSNGDADDFADMPDDEDLPF